MTLGKHRSHALTATPPKGDRTNDKSHSTISKLACHIPICVPSMSPKLQYFEPYDYFYSFIFSSKTNVVLVKANSTILFHYSQSPTKFLQFIFPLLRSSTTLCNVFIFYPLLDLFTSCFQFVIYWDKTVISPQIIC